MKNQPTTSEVFEALEQAGGNASAAARDLGVPPRTMRRWVQQARAIERGEGEVEKKKISKQDSVEGSIESSKLLMSEDEVLRSYGYDPSKYNVLKMDIAERDGGTVTAPKTARTISLSLTPKPKPITPAFDGRPITLKHRKPKKTAKPSSGERVVILGDYHAPYVEQDLHEKSLELIDNYKPTRIIVNGDLVDFPTVGRHRKVTDECTAEANECVQAGGEILKDIRLTAGEEARIQFIPGNHDAWLNNYMLDNAEAAYGICRYGEETPALDLANLFQFDKFGIEMIGKPSVWQKAAIHLTDHLSVFHGGPIDKKAGGSALKAMIDGQGAWISNHIHRAAIVSKTVWHQGQKKTFQGGEAGCMCQVRPEGFPTYMEKPDWHQGFMTADIEPDGHYSLELATYQNDVLMWRGQRYE
jgi:hypothetical protein